MLKLFKRKKDIDILTPMNGEIVNIEDVPDEVFSQKMVGDGIAIQPTEGTVSAPCNGKIVQVFPTKHAIGIETDEGLQILIHIGIDTVELKGKGFKTFVDSGDIVKAGDKLLEVDLDYLKENGKPITTPVVITNMSEVDNLVKMEGAVKTPSSMIMKVELKRK